MHVYVDNGFIGFTMVNKQDPNQQSGKNILQYNTVQTDGKDIHRNFIVNRLPC